jgi:hypothetical protein
MREPNFSESQLQQAANTAFIRRIVDHHGVWAFAHVPSLIAEFDLGWDTAFHLPWFPHTPSASDEGCNFFLQYKLSSELTSPGAKEWPHWGEEYLRFKIPHSTRDSSGQFIDDYHQWESLKALADKGYPTFYATNSTLHKVQLQNSLTAGTLLDYVPLLDVRGIAALHKHVTFAAAAGIFALHSEKEEARKLSFTEALGQLAQSRQSSLAASNKEVLVALKELGENDETWKQDLARIAPPRDQPFPRQLEAFFQHMLLASFVRKHVGAELLWLPKGG